MPRTLSLPYSFLYLRTEGPPKLSNAEFTCVHNEEARHMSVLFISSSRCGICITSFCTWTKHRLLEVPEVIYTQVADHTTIYSKDKCMEKARSQHNDLSPFLIIDRVRNSLTQSGSLTYGMLYLSPVDPSDYVQKLLRELACSVVTVRTLVTVMKISTLG